jgi:hypothetical protein
MLSSSNIERVPPGDRRWFFNLESRRSNARTRATYARVFKVEDWLLLKSSRIPEFWNSLPVLLSRFPSVPPKAPFEQQTMRELLRSAVCGFAFSTSPSRQYNAVRLQGLRRINRSSRSRISRTMHCQTDPNERALQKIGNASNKLEKQVRREKRISSLSTRSDPLSNAELKELDGLLKADQVYEEQYCVTDFSDAHIAYKAAHNDVFVSLAHFCQSQSKNDVSNSDTGTSSASKAPAIKVFYLDGPNAATTFALQSAGFDSTQCYTANRHSSTCDALRSYLPHENVVHASAADALTSKNKQYTNDNDRVQNVGAFGDVSFSAYYFDGCGGYTPLIIDMMTAAFDSDFLQPPIAVGFSILGGNRDVVDKEQDVLRQLVAMVKPFGMRVDHVLDDPGRYGFSSDTRKLDGGTVTSWCMLEKDCR